MLLGVAAIGLPFVTILTVLPDIGWELGFEPYMRSPSLAVAGELPHALSWGWIALAVVLAALGVSLWERVSVAATAGLGIATFAAVSLAAGHFEALRPRLPPRRAGRPLCTPLFGPPHIMARDPLRDLSRRLPWLRWESLLARAL